MGIQVNFHPGEYGLGEDFQIIGNTIDGVGSHGMYITANRVTISNNLLKNIGGYGITAWPGEEYTITDNVLRNISGVGIAVGGEKTTVSGNQIFEVQAPGISIVDGISVTVSNNILENAGGIMIYAPEAEVTVVNNHIAGAEYALILGRDRIAGEVLNKVVVQDNDFDNILAGWLHLAALVKNLEVEPAYTDSIVDAFDFFKAPLPASTNYVHRAIAGSGAEQDTTTQITNPDAPRNISITTTNNAAPSGYIRVEGTNARGDADSEKIAIVAGGTAYGNKAFATITKLTIPAGVSPTDTVEIGVSDKLGLTYPIQAATDVYLAQVYVTADRWMTWKVSSEIPPVDVANGTIDFPPIPANPDPDFPTYGIKYKTRLTSD